MPAAGRLALDRAAQLGHGEDWEGRERRLLAIAGEQHGVVALAQLRSVGFSAQGVRSRVAARRLHSVYRGVYAVGRPELSAEGRWMAATLACGRGALLSHRSAASLHRLLSSFQRAIEVTVPRRVTLSRPGIRVHRSTCLRDSDRMTVRGIPCTSVARTLLDLAAVLDRRSLERACEQAEVLRLIDWAAMDEALLHARGRAGVRRLRAVIGTGDIGADVPRSELERRFLALCRRMRLPRPAVNDWLTVGGEEMQVDFAWHAQRLIVETDGFAVHRTRQAFVRDRRRDRLLSLAGWQVSRFTWEEVTKDPMHVTGVVRRLLARAAQPASPAG